MLGDSDGVTMDAVEARARFSRARVAGLATVDAGGAPHLVPVTFAVAGEVVVTAVDHKPKRTTALRRLRDIAANARVSLLVDEYDDEDWTRLWWVRADGRARVLTDERDRADPVRWLCQKYPQYRDTPPAGPVIWIAVRTWRGWSYRSGAAPDRPPG
ncbi:PPOX class probable F420-dependent enzyme, Rv0121 family [Goodfellowiella coeruleoviolacea]|uniref:PPOX class probable F420-dependent enzyme, Rv0121 family n=1 Tax=Goodfellowiella coeruleoviolacea TaxID=334858 RepID=A0AAE3GF29_9PSEU|nr:PPOX class probable F420-dependent enzyme, Rv0121 family [Goodfellowiella coeruleoviolacea]